MDAAEPQQSPLQQTLRNLAAGTMGGWSQTLVGHPFHTVKVRLQTSTHTLTAMSCVRETARKGLSDFYKGVASPLLGQGLMNAVQYTTYGNMKILCGGDDLDLVPMAPQRYLLVGALTGTCISIVDSPVDLLKIKMQAQVNAGTTYSGVLDAATRIFARYGIRGIYQGLPATIVRDAPCNASYFFAYEWTRQALARRDGCDLKELSASRLLLSGGVAGAAYWSFLYPIEVVKSALQGDHSDPAKRQYRGMRDCWRQIYARYGVRGFWRGWLPCVLRSVPANAACFFAYEKTRQALN